MNTHLFAPVIFGLAASLCWGSGDFSGGLASRRAYTGSVVLTDYAVGFILLVTLALIWKEPAPAPADLLWGWLAGVAGARFISVGVLLMLMWLRRKPLLPGMAVAPHAVPPP